MSTKTILIVDDEQTAREALAKVLLSEGFQALTAADSHEAMQHLAHQPADTVLLDLDLPHVPGDSVAHFINLRYPRTRIIFMSGQYDMVDCERFGEHTLYFRKPLDIESLVEILRTSTSTEAASS
jgi:DNA-binding NtrC family response regulator